MGKKYAWMRKLCCDAKVSLGFLGGDKKISAHFARELNK